MSTQARSLSVPRLRLRGKIVALVVAVVLVSTLMTSVSSFLRSRDREYTLALTELEDVADNHARELGKIIDDMAVDARIIADLAMVPRIVETIAVPGSDLDGPDSRARIEALRGDLSTILVNLIEKRPHYTQLRLIGSTGDWHEIARVNQTRTGPRVVAREQLQHKGDEGYLKAIVDAASGAPLFFKVTRNREFGEVVGAPTLRLVQPVLDADGTVSAAIVINADYEALLQRAAILPAPGVRVTAVNRSLDYMVFSADDPSPRLVSRSDPDWTQPAEIEAFAAGSLPTEPVAQDRIVSVLRKVRHSEDPDSFALYTITRESFAALLDGANTQLRHDLMTSALMVLGSGLIALVAAMHLTEPLLSLHRQIASGNTTALGASDLYDSTDEIGDLARVFLGLTQELLFKTSRAVAIFRNAGIAIAVFEKDGTIDDVNPAACALFGHDSSDLIGKNISEILPDDAILKCFENRDDLDATSSFSVQGRPQTGPAIDLEVTLRLASSMSGARIIAIIRDVTEFKRNQEDIARLVQKLKQSNAELDQFAYVASHDLKAPLRVIDNASRWLCEDLEPHLTDDTRESLVLLRNRVQRMERLLDDLLTHSRVGRVNIETEQISGDVLVGEILDLLDKPDGIRISVQSGFDAILVPRMPLETILLNLISNAIMHHDRDQGVIEIGSCLHDDEIEIVISDDGPGIDPKYHDKIFQIFQTLKPRDQVESSGMGLAIVKKYADLSGGRIVVESDGCRGTTFRVFWPKSDSWSDKIHRLAS